MFETSLIFCCGKMPRRPLVCRLVAVLPVLLLSYSGLSWIGGPCEDGNATEKQRIILHNKIKKNLQVQNMRRDEEVKIGLQPKIFCFNTIGNSHGKTNILLSNYLIFLLF